MYPINDIVKKIKRIEFGVQSPETRELLSQVVVDDYSGMESGLKKDGSLYDLKMGTVTKKIDCVTCGRNSNHDCGHFGIVKLATPIYNILFIKKVLDVLVCTCFKCGGFLVTDLEIVKNILKYPRKYRMSYCKHYAKLKKFNLCKICNFKNDISYKIVKELDVHSSYKGSGKYTVMYPSITLENFKKLKDVDIESMGFDKNKSRPAWFILESVLVPPTTIRPSMISNEGNQRTESNLYKLFSNIIKTNNKLKNQLENGKLYDDKVYKFYEALAFSIASLFTSKQSNKNMGGIFSLGSGKIVSSISEMYKDKDGIIRGNLLGKRTDWSSRSVISSESMLKIDELGVPIWICMRMTMKITVKKNNINELRGYIMNGENKYVGATRVVKKGIDNSKRDRYISLVGDDSKLKLVSDELRYGDIVYRHIIKGDLMLFNRQPSLHKLSMMAFKIIPIENKKSFRLNSFVCEPYNADFDGDEMNGFVVHHQQSLAEMREILMSDNHVINPTKSNVTIGPIQDNVLGIWIISKDKNMKILKTEFMDIIYKTKYYDIEYIWDLKDYKVGDLLNCVLPRDLIYISNNLHIKNGVLISGLMNNGNIRKIIKIIFLNYGKEITKNVLYALQRLSDTYLMNRGFSIGIDDCIVPKNVKNKIRGYLYKAQRENNKLLEDYDNNRIVTPITMKINEDFEIRARNIISRCDVECKKIIDEYLQKLDKEGNPNNFTYMVSAGSKGKMANIYQILGYVGQQIVDSERIPKTYGDRTMPYYTKYDESLESRGFVLNSYSDGINPKEFYMIAKSARNDLMDKVLKTADVGYEARRNVKLMESIVAQYDGTVRMYNLILSNSFGGYHWDMARLSDNKLTLYDDDLDSLLAKIY